MITDDLAHRYRVLPRDMGAFARVAGPRSGERDPVRQAVVEEVMVDEIRPVVRVDANDRNPRHTCRSALNTHFSVLFLTDRFTVHSIAMSATARMKQNSPEAFPPTWPIKSISTNPGTESFWSAQVDIWACDYGSVPGLAIDRPRESSFARSGASQRSFVAKLSVTVTVTVTVQHPREDAPCRRSRYLTARGPTPFSFNTSRNAARA